MTSLLNTAFTTAIALAFIACFAAFIYYGVNEQLPHVIGFSILWAYVTRIFVNTPFSGPIQADGTYNFALHRLEYDQGYQVAFGTGNNTLTLRMRVLALILPFTCIGRYTYDNGNVVFELSLMIPSQSLAITLGRWFKQESIWDWSNSSLIYLQGR